VRLKPEGTGVNASNKKNVYLYLDDEPGGLHWECFSPAISSLPPSRKGVTAQFPTFR
jgi:hypothetical protein